MGKPSTAGGALAPLPAWRALVPALQCPSAMQLQRSLQPVSWTDRWRLVVVGILLPVAFALALTAYIRPR